MSKEYRVTVAHKDGKSTPTVVHEVTADNPRDAVSSATYNYGQHCRNPGADNIVVWRVAWVRGEEEWTVPSYEYVDQRRLF